MNWWSDIHSSDIADLLRLAAEVGELPRSEPVRRRHILESLRQLVGGASAACFEQDHSGTPVNVISTPDAAEPLAHPADPHTLHARVSMPDGRVLMMQIRRAENDRPFTERERQLVQMFNSGAAHLFQCSRRAQAPQGVSIPIHDPSMDDLAPRLRPVLRRLLAGDAEKQVALKLGLSPHTVHQYAKLLHRHFKVSSRAELLAQFIKPPDAHLPAHLPAQTDEGGSIDPPSPSPLGAQYDVT